MGAGDGDPLGAGALRAVRHQPDDRPPVDQRAGARGVALPRAGARHLRRPPPHRPAAPPPDRLLGGHAGPPAAAGRPRPLGGDVAGRRPGGRSLADSPRPARLSGPPLAPGRQRAARHRDGGRQFHRLRAAARRRPGGGLALPVARDEVPPPAGRGGAGGGGRRRVRGRGRAARVGGRRSGAADPPRHLHGAPDAARVRDGGLSGRQVHVLHSDRARGGGG